MTRVLDSVLSRSDLPEAELHAAKLDGELFAVDECFALVDEVDHVRLRAAALRAVLPPRLIAEQRTAAWVLGAIRRIPTPHELCAESSARYRPAGLVVREVLLHEGDTVVIGGLRLTTPFRTALDLARFADEFDAADRETVLRLAEIGRFEVAALLGHLESRRHLPQKLRAGDRLRPLAAGGLSRR
jgi:hypothetical protein